MGTAVRWLRRLMRSVRREDAERDMEAEMRFHVEMDAAERVVSGADAAEARPAASVSFA